MSDLKLCLIKNTSAKQIEDVIDARKQIGQYNILRKKSFIDIQGTAMWLSESELSDYSDEAFALGPTDSEITVVRVKREGMQHKGCENKWNLHDDAVPGDGSHLGESPSLVNLVTLVGQTLADDYNLADDYKEYLVPISSWDPGDYPHQITDDCAVETVKKQKTSVSLRSNDVNKHRSSPCIYKGYERSN